MKKFSFEILLWKLSCLYSGKCKKVSAMVV